MSLYLKVERFGAAPRLLRIRAFATSVGLDGYGVLCTGTPEEPLLTIFNSDSAFLIQANAAGVIFRGNPLPVGGSEQLMAGDSIAVQEFTMTAFLTSDEADFYPSEQLPTMLWGSLEFTLAGLHQSVPLRGGSFSVGSGSDDTVPLPLPGIVARHLVGEINGEQLTLSAPSAEVQLQDGQPLGLHCTTGDTSVCLAPLGIQVHFRRCSTSPLAHSPADGGTFNT